MSHRQQATFSSATLWVLLVACCSAFVVGCASRYAAESRPGSPDATRIEVGRLSASAQARIPREMRAAAKRSAPTRTDVGLAEYGARWSDMDLAVHLATADLEMAVIRIEPSPESRHYTIETVDEKPVTLTVHRRPPPEIYEAEAAVGRFGDDHARADALIEALSKKLLALGRKRGFSGE